jgi:hypothetical protein
MMSIGTQTKFVAIAGLALVGFGGRPATAGDLVPGGWGRPIHAVPVTPPVTPAPATVPKAGRSQTKPVAHSRAKSAAPRQPVRVPASDGTIQY